MFTPSDGEYGMVVAWVEIMAQPVVPRTTRAPRASDAMRRDFTDPPGTDDDISSILGVRRRQCAVARQGWAANLSVCRLWYPGGCRKDITPCFLRLAKRSSTPITGPRRSSKSKTGSSRARQKYLKLHVTQGDLTIEVPAENVDLVGVRDVIGKEGLDRVFEVLRAPFTEEPTNWSRRYKANLEKLASGDVIKVSEVVRDLWRRDQDRGLSAGEKRMLAKAKQILISELALAEKTDEEQAGAILDEVLAS